MTREEAKKRLVSLRAQLDQYAHEYYVRDNPSVDDSVYDGLMAELKKIEAEFPELITTDSPTQRVGAKPLAGFKQVTHRTRMISLNDVFDRSEVEAWAVRMLKLAPESHLEFFVDIKMDGLACSIIYEDGIYSQAVTRGDGMVGEDVTENIRTIPSVPLRLRNSAGNKDFLSGRTEVRGEVIMYKKNFAKLNETRQAEGLATFANPRNLAAGTIRQLDPSLVAKRPLHFRAYDLLVEPPSRVASHEFAYRTLDELGFLVNKPTFKDSYVAKDVATVMKAVAQWENERLNLEFNTDGLVVKINDRALYDRLGVAGKAPRAAIAYKYAAEQSTTKVKDIFISIGRTGAATPVAMLEPVVIAGTTVQMATLHNESEVARKDIRIGDTVVVRKAGDIIPEVVEPITKLRNGTEKVFHMPKRCPECNTVLIKSKKDDAVWRCPNIHCPARVQNRIQHFASKAAMDIDGMGEKNVGALLSAGAISDPADVYALKKEELLKLDRFAEISASKLIEAIEAKKQPNLNRFIYGLGIRHVGAQTAVDLANHFRSMEGLIKATIEELSNVEGIGEVVAESIVAWFSEEANVQLLEKFKRYNVWPRALNKVGGKLTGKRFVVTGTLRKMDRDEAAEKIRLQGGVFQSSVGKETDYLVVGENVGKSKLEKAQKLGTKQINEDELINLLN